MKNIIKGFGLALALITTSAHAIPTLFFDGTISYDSATERLSVVSNLYDTYDVDPAPLLEGELNFDAQLISAFSGFGLSIGSFGTVDGQDDLRVLDASSAELLTGSFDSLTMSGGIGDDNGAITGLLSSSGGSLQSLFGVGNLIALEFNLSTDFHEAMFDGNFSGDIGGRIEGESTSVPEPNVLVLLSLGLLLVGFVKKAA